MTIKNEDSAPYRILFDYGVYEGNKFDDKEFAWLDDAIKYAVGLGYGTPFRIVQIAWATDKPPSTSRAATPLPTEDDLERACQWVLRRGYATGPADTIEDLLEEFHGQLKRPTQSLPTDGEVCRIIREEIVRQFREGEREKCAAGIAFYEEEVSPFLIARAVLQFMKERRASA